MAVKQEYIIHQWCVIDDDADDDYDDDDDDDEKQMEAQMVSKVQPFHGAFRSPYRVIFFSAIPLRIEPASLRRILILHKYMHI